uniref:fructose-bisphosphatase n=1 Tax=Tetraselmis sp. GSL018 TaxID=582737 RepID=A0A061QYB8_9CHLO|mmetsp:Transcript_36071/g.85580  ORF Transcript_36071/g.85580 Transcript_36071/m.85580 type:complete len:422 (-) Transcript_36071:951-2216(-)
MSLRRVNCGSTCQQHLRLASLRSSPVATSLFHNTAGKENQIKGWKKLRFQKSSGGCRVLAASNGEPAAPELAPGGVYEGQVLGSEKYTTLQRFLMEEVQWVPEAEDSDLAILLSDVASATKRIADVLASAGIEGLMGKNESVNMTGDKQQKLDVVANDILKDALASCGQVRSIASEEEDEVLLTDPNGRYAVVFDPLDGSRNIDAAIPTGTIFGVHVCQPVLEDTMDELEWALSDCLQPGDQLVAAGYALYSSATMFVLTLGNGTHGFTLDRRTGDYVLTHRNITIPERGQIYSVNDARYHDWPRGLQRYIDAIRRGEGESPKQYSARYICSLVADFHRTLLYGGVAMNPRSHLRLVYEGNPLSMIAEQASGVGSDGRRRILSIKPDRLHQRLPLFLGSPKDIAELESYEDVQQEAKTYEV